MILDYNIIKKEKDFFVDKLKKELELIKFKVKFIDYVINEKIIIYKQKNDIIKKLEELEFPKLGNECNYDYITNIPLFNLTLEKIEELNKLFKLKEKELDNYINTTIKDMWKNELKVLLNKYKNFK